MWIASSALAYRIKLLWDQLIPDNQTGIIDGRLIGETTRLIYDLMNTAQLKNINGL